MADADRSVRDDAAQADLWDAVADERQRLTDEREQLANERDQLADERERLADERERLLDQRSTALDDDLSSDDLRVESVTRAEAEGRVARAQARVERALAERERAESAVERDELGRARSVADRERAARRTDGVDGDDAWGVERRRFVAAERAHVADDRDADQTTRDELAHRREHDADARDRDERARERSLDESEARRFVGPKVAPEVLRAREDLSQVREDARRQRRIAARTRRRASADRAGSRSDASAAGFVPTAFGPLLAAEFVTLTRELFASPNLAEIVDRVLGFALECFPAYVAAGATIAGTGRPELRVATDPAAERLDALQFDTGEGPAILALQSTEPVYAPTVASWPTLVPAATELGIVGAVSFGLAVPREGMWQPLGAMTLYSEIPAELDADSRDVGSTLSAYLAVAAGLDRDRHDLNRREAALHRALGTRDVIGQAKGILMERQHVPAGEAFDILRRTSQRLNIRLAEVAERLAETGEIPT